MAGRKIGWAVGTTDGGEWLTVWGSAVEPEHKILFADPADAVARRDRINAKQGDLRKVIVRKVERLDAIHWRILAG